MKKTIVYFIIASISGMSCTKSVSIPTIKKSNTELMRKRSDPNEDAKHY